MILLGYKLRKHISKALQVRSKAIRAALDRYNDAAKRMLPPRPQLTWDQIVEYAFLSDFDILCDSRQDIRKRPWAQPANRILMDKHFKIERAQEEIIRLNVEIKRIVTHIVDEENYLLKAEENATTPTLAYFIQQYRLERTRFSRLHLVWFSKLSNQPSFTSSLVPGNVLDKSLGPIALPSEGLMDKEPSSPGVPTMLHSAHQASDAPIEDAMDVDLDRPPVIEAPPMVPTALLPPALPSTATGNMQNLLPCHSRPSPQVATPASPSPESRAQLSQNQPPLVPNPDQLQGFAIQYLPLHLTYEDLGDEDAEGETDDGGIGDIDADGESDNEDVEYLDFAFTSIFLAMGDK